MPAWGGVVPSALQNAAAGPVLYGGAPAFDSNQFNVYGRPIYITLRCGVISAPGQNGHIYLEISAASPVSWIGVDYCACRDQALNQDTIGAGQGLQGICPAGWFYRFRTFTVATFATPTFVTDGASPFSITVL